ncbi:MAG TPA: type II/IV secretion system ATPase subunit [Nitrososphaerales archaeon]|nr:type II/IV secretion system ATPase subunit [Nitrososphaerales archaeon]
MKLSKGLLLGLAIMVLADFVIGYLTLESLNSFTGAHRSLPLSSILVRSVGLSPVVAGTFLGAVLVSFSGVFVFWLWTRTPEVIAKHLGIGRNLDKTVLEPTEKPLNGGIMVGDLERAKPLNGGMMVGDLERVQMPLNGGMVMGNLERMEKPRNRGMKVSDLQLAQNAESAETKPFVEVVQLEEYPLKIYAAVTKEEGREGYTYAVIEPSLSEAEKARLVDLKKLLVDELDVDLKSIQTPEKAERYLSAKVRGLAKKYGYKIAPPAMTKLLYYLNRDFIHLGKIEPLMKDKLIEDISCDGAGIPIFIWYRDYESIPTNIVFATDEELDTYVSKLAYSAGKHVSLAEPIVDASLPDGSRVHLTFGKEVTQRGSTFTIRKFRVDPLTVVDLIKYNTLSSDVAAYLWYLIEKKLALLIAGGTASGKTTLLNALSMFIEPGEKIVSVEDTPELNLPHDNWIQSVTRGVGTTNEITMFDLLKASLRQRPDFIIVGEVRGEEAFTLLQSIATGHGGLGTIHADSVEATINRLTTEPMNIPRSLVGTTLDCIVMQLKLRLSDRSVRRVVAVTEVVGHDRRTDEIILNDAFTWDPVGDRFLFTGRSKLFDKITQKYGTRPEEIRREIDGRKLFLDWLVAKDVRGHTEVSNEIREFYAGPYAVINKAKVELEALKA